MARLEANFMRLLQLLVIEIFDIKKINLCSPAK